MVRITAWLGLVFLFSLLLAVSTLAESPPQTDCLYYFYGDADGCNDCAETNAQVNRLSLKYPDLAITQYNVYNNFDNYRLLQQYFAAYSIPEESQNVPVLFMSKSYLIGGPAITELLESRILDNEFTECPSLENVQVIGLISEGSPHQVIETLTLPRVALYGFKDGLNACVLTMVLVLLGLLLLINEKRRLFRASLAFVIAIFAVYFLRGIGEARGWDWLSPLGTVSFAFTVIIGLLSIAAGVAIIISFFKSRHALLFANQEKLIRKWVSPLTIFPLGLIFAYFSLSCFGLKYQLLTSLLKEQIAAGKALFLMGYYAFFAVLFLLIIFLIGYWIFVKLEVYALAEGQRINEVNAWKRYHLRIFRLILGVLLIVIGILALVL